MLEEEAVAIKQTSCSKHVKTYKKKVLSNAMCITSHYSVQYLSKLYDESENNEHEMRNRNRYMG